MIRSREAVLVRRGGRTALSPFSREGACEEASGVADFRGTASPPGNKSPGASLTSAGISHARGAIPAYINQIPGFMPAAHTKTGNFQGLTLKLHSVRSFLDIEDQSAGPRRSGAIPRPIRS